MRPALAPVVLGLISLGPALLSCGGGGGGGGGPSPTCSRWQPPAASGPGDAAGHLPLAVGNRWVFGRSGTSAAPWTSWVAGEVTGTRTVLGRSAWVLAESDLDSHAPLGEVYWGLDDHGLVDLGNDDPADTITPLLVPYYLVRFPLEVGDQFTSVECTALDYGEDLDGDHRNERLDVRVDVSVVAVEPVETAVASFPEATRLQALITATLRATASGDSETVQSLETDWLVPGVGRVKQRVEVPIGSAAPSDALLGYRVGGTLKGLVARRTLTSGTLLGRLRAAPLGGAYLVASGNGSPPAPGGGRAMALRVTPGGPADAQPFALVDMTVEPTSIAEVTTPALAVWGSGLLAVTTTWNGVAGDVRVQRIDASGALLDGVAGRVIATAVQSNPGFGGGPWVATDGSGFLVVWCELDRLQAIRLDASGQPAGPVQTLAGPTALYAGPGSAAVAFDGTRYLVLYEWLGTLEEQLRALHLEPDGTVVEANPLILSDAPGAKRVVSALFDGVQHLLLLVDGRDPAGVTLTLRRLDPAGAFLDGDAATGGVVLADSPDLPASGSGLMAFDGTRTFVAWVDEGVVRLVRIALGGMPLDAQGGRAGLVAIDSDPTSNATLDAPTPLPTGDGTLELLYLVRDALAGPPALRGVLFGP